MAEKIDDVIIGGGVIGLSIAYNLTKRGHKTLTIESSYLNAGATGASLGIIHIRLPRYEPDLVELLKLGNKMHRSLPIRTRINTYHRDAGTLTVAMDSEEARQLENLHKEYEKHGIQEHSITPHEIKRRWQYIDASSFASAYYTPREAVAHPFGMVWAYYENIRKNGSEVLKETSIESIKETSHGYKIKVANREYETDRIIIAAGTGSPSLMREFGYDVNITPKRKEVLISEPMRPFLGPTIQRLSNSYSITQTMRGELLGSVDWLEPGYDTGETTPDTLYKYMRETVSIIPALKNLRLIRQWTGVMDVLEDENPAVGRIDEEVYTAFGFYDYGVTLAPAIGKLLSKEITTGEREKLLEPINLKRLL